MSRVSTAKVSIRCESDSRQRSDPRQESKLYSLLFEEWRPVTLLCHSGEDGTVCNPWFFCLDVAGNILITDRDRHDVKILSPSGHLIHEIGKVGHGRGEFVYPHGICVSEQGIVFVVSWNKNFVLQSF